MDSIGERLRRLRIKMKRTLREQSEIFGVSINTVYRWEHDLAIPREAALKKMAEYYDVSPHWLVLGRGNEETESENNDNDDGARQGSGSAGAKNNNEQQLLKMFRRLPENIKYKILGFIEHTYVECISESVRAELGD